MASPRTHTNYLTAITTVIVLYAVVLQVTLGLAAIPQMGSAGQLVAQVICSSSNDQTAPNGSDEQPAHSCCLFACRLILAGGISPPAEFRLAILPRLGSLIAYAAVGPPPTICTAPRTTHARDPPLFS